MHALVKFRNSLITVIRKLQNCVSHTSGPLDIEQSQATSNTGSNNSKF